MPRKKSEKIHEPPSKSMRLGPLLKAYFHRSGMDSATFCGRNGVGYRELTGWTTEIDVPSDAEAVKLCLGLSLSEPESRFFRDLCTISRRRVPDDLLTIPIEARNEILDAFDRARSIAQRVFEDDQRRYDEKSGAYRRETQT